MHHTFDIAGAKEILDAEGYAWLKYVRLGDTYIFANADAIFTAPDHKFMVEENQREQVVSAAYLKVRPDGMTIVGDSRTLEKYPAPDDTEKLAELFGIPCETEY